MEIVSEGKIVEISINQGKFRMKFNEEFENIRIRVGEHTFHEVQSVNN